MADHAPNLQPDDDPLVKMSRGMLAIGKSEEQLFRVVTQGRTPGRVHLSDGHEAVAVDTCVQLDDLDQVASTRRGQGHDLAKGGDQFTAIGQDFRVVLRA